MMSTHLPESEVSLFNQSPAGAIPVSKELQEVLEAGIQWGEASGGAFDISIEPLVQLWNFDGEKSKIPAKTAIEHAVQQINFRDLRLADGKLIKPRDDLKINLGAIAKGYAVDHAIDILRGLVPAGIINAGGDLYAFGQREPDHPWIIGLQHPRRPQDLLASFALEQRAVATSGDYQRYFMQDGTRYHHILNPETGMTCRRLDLRHRFPRQQSCKPDALSTAVFVMGADKGLEWIESIATAEAMVILEDGTARFSKGFQVLPQFNLRPY